MQDNENRKEGAKMAIAMKPNEATIIKTGMLPAFLNELQENKVTKEYWEECETSRTFFTPSDIEEMKRMCNGEKNE